MKRRRHSEQDDSDSCSTLSTQNEEEAAEEAGQAAAPCERQQRLLQQREQCAAAKLQLEEVLQRSRERHKHLAQQLEELAGCDSGSDAVDTSDLQRQLQACEEQEASAAGQLHQLDASFKAAVADIMGLTPSPQLAAAIQRQQQLCEDEVQQAAVTGQLDTTALRQAGRPAKKARTEVLTQVWDWLREAGSGGEGEEAAPGSSGRAGGSAATAAGSVPPPPGQPCGSGSALAGLPEPCIHRQSSCVSSG